MNSEVQKLINEAVRHMIDNTSTDKKIKGLIETHNKKIHFIPKRYRLFGGMLQSMNIQFGNFIEELMTVFVANNKKYEIVEKYSGKKSNKFLISVTNEKLIDEYITRCQTEDMALDEEFPILMKKIINDKAKETKIFEHDIDLLFKNKETGVYYYLEIKYNDDHDTGKFVSINRKFIKTSAYLINELNIKDLKQFKPILFFFNNKKMKGNIYVPEDTNIYRGEKFFDEFLDIKYSDVEKYMEKLSENSTTVEEFNKLYEKVMNYDK